MANNTENTQEQANEIIAQKDLKLAINYGNIKATKKYCSFDIYEDYRAEPFSMKLLTDQLHLLAIWVSIFASKTGGFASEFLYYLIEQKLELNLLIMDKIKNLKSEKKFNRYISFFEFYNSLTKEELIFLTATCKDYNLRFGNNPILTENIVNDGTIKEGDILYLKNNALGEILALVFDTRKDGLITIISGDANGSVTNDINYEVLQADEIPAESFTFLQESQEKFAEITETYKETAIKRNLAKTDKAKATADAEKEQTNNFKKLCDGAKILTSEAEIIEYRKASYSTKLNKEQRATFNTLLRDRKDTLISEAKATETAQQNEATARNESLETIKAEEKEETPTT